LFPNSNIRLLDHQIEKPRQWTVENAAASAAFPWRFQPMGAPQIALLSQEGSTTAGRARGGSHHETSRLGPPCALRALSPPDSGGELRLRQLPGGFRPVLRGDAMVVQFLQDVRDHFVAVRIVELVPHAA